MAQETSSLEIERDFNHTEVRLTQRPLVGWGILTLLIGWGGPVGFGATILGVADFSLPVMVGAMWFFAVSLMWKRTATLSIGRQQIRIDAWTGRLARPARLTLPLDRLELEHSHNVWPSGQKEYHLTLTSPRGKTHRIGALACTDEDLQTLTSVIEEAQQLSMPDAGTDADVPDQLRTTMGTAGKQAT